MIATQSIRDFHDLIAALPELAPPGVIADPAQAAAPAPQLLLSPGALPADPDHCAITGVIDHAIPFAHPSLKTAEVLSRVAAVWLQDAPAARRVKDIPFGAELTGAQIDAVPPGDPDGAYRMAGLMDAARGGRAVFLRDASHAAVAAGLAAGFEPDDPAGRRHPVLAMSMPDFSIADTSGTMSPLFIQAGVILPGRPRPAPGPADQRGLRAPGPAAAGGQPVDGDHRRIAGRTIRHRAAAGRHRRDPRTGHRAVPFRAGRGQFASGSAAWAAAGQSLGWQLPPADPTPSVLEIWPEAAGQGLGLRLTAPDGQACNLTVAPGQAGLWQLRGPEGAVRMQVAACPAIAAPRCR